MKIYGINSFSFTAKNIKTPVNNIKNIQPSMDEIKAEKLYAPIKKYLKKESNNAEYIDSFMDFYNEFKNSDCLSPYEKKYMIDVMTTIDLSKNPSGIPRNYMTEKMQKLLEFMSK